MCLINYSSFVFTYNIMFVSNFELKKNRRIVRSFRLLINYVGSRGEMIEKCCSRWRCVSSLYHGEKKAMRIFFFFFSTRMWMKIIDLLIDCTTRTIYFKQFCVQYYTVS